MIERLKAVVENLAYLRDRAEKYRAKQGHVDLPADDVAALLAARGKTEEYTTQADGSVRMAFSVYVELVDGYLEAVSQAALDAIADASGEPA